MNISFIKAIWYFLRWLVDKDSLLVEKGERAEGTVLDNSYDRMKWKFRRGGEMYGLAMVKVHEITYKYEIGGQRISAKQEGNELWGLGLRNGDQVAVLYLPWNPSKSGLAI